MSRKSFWNLSARTVVARWVSWPRREEDGLRAIFALGLAEAALSYAAKRLPRRADRKSATALRRRVRVLLRGEPE